MGCHVFRSTRPSRKRSTSSFWYPGVCRRWNAKCRATWDLRTLRNSPSRTAFINQSLRALPLLPSVSNTTLMYSATFGALNPDHSAMGLLPPSPSPDGAIARRKSVFSNPIHCPCSTVMRSCALPLAVACPTISWPSLSSVYLTKAMHIRTLATIIFSGKESSGKLRRTPSNPSLGGGRLSTRLARPKSNPLQRAYQCGGFPL